MPDGPLGGTSFGDSGFFSPLTPTPTGGGRRFTSNGWVFTKAGGKFVHDDGTCEACDCDNPPGSGTNMGDCSYCDGGIAPFSLLVSFLSIGYATSCVNVSPAGHSFPIIGFRDSFKTVGTYDFTDYCLQVASGCQWTDGGANNSLLDIRNEFYTFPNCDPSGGGVVRRGFRITVFYGPEDGVGGVGPIGWTVTIATDGGFYFYGFTQTDGDCTTPFSVTNDLVKGTIITSPYGGIGGGTKYLALTTGGSVAVTPQFALCS
jgi:hypothetical protein